MALEMGMDEGGAEHVAIVATEACTNLLKHASGGQVLLQTTTEESDAATFLELLAVDQGPGMSNLDQCLRDGFSTGSSPGQGLGAIQRMSKQSDIYTLPGKGTVILARWGLSRNGTKPAVAGRLGAVNVSMPGEDVCGDAWGSVRNGDDLVIIVADGLGHGLEARLASSEAVRQLYQEPQLLPKALLMRVHQALRSTRGAAVAVARIDSVRGKLTFAGVGNISARIYAGLGKPAEPGVAERNRRPSMRAHAGVQLCLARGRAAGSPFRRSFHRHWIRILSWPGGARSGAHRGRALPGFLPGPR